MAQNPLFPNTTFPDEFQNIQYFADVTQSDAPLLQQFFTAMQAGNFSEANRIFNQIPDGAQKIISADKLNIMRDTLLAMEEFYTKQIAGTITQKQNEWTNLINLFTYRNEFSPVVQYEKNNMVMYVFNGVRQMYICVSRPPVGTYPNNTTYWRVLTIRGEKGDAGSGSTFGFEWDSSLTYASKTIVVYNNSWWSALSSNRNQPPYEGSPYWNLVLNVKQAVYPISPNQPPSQATGELWFREM